MQQQRAESYIRDAFFFRPCIVGSQCSACFVCFLEVVYKMSDKKERWTIAGIKIQYRSVHAAGVKVTESLGMILIVSTIHH